MSGTLTRKVCPRALAGRLFFLCAVTYIVALFGRLSYSAVMAELITAEGLSKSQAGLIGTALCGVYGVFQIFSGMIGDRVSPKKLVFTGVMGSAILNLLMGISGSYYSMLALWALNGVFQSFVWSPVARIFAEMMPPERRKKSCSDAAITYPLATVLVYLLASVMLMTFGWRSVFLISSVMMIVTSLYWMYRMTMMERQTEENGEIETVELNEQEQKNGDSLLHLMILSGVIFAVVGALSHGMLRDGIQAWVPSLMTENFHFGTSLSVALAIILPLINISGVFLTKAIAKNHIHNEFNGSEGFFLITIFSLIVLYFVCGSNAILSLLMMTIASTCMVGSNIMLINLIPIHFGVIGRSSSITGVLNCSAYLGSALSSYGIGAVAEHFGWRGAVLMWLVFSVFALLLALCGSKRWGRYRHNI
ncbi:MAG: MFS transporter [Eubacteriales bacterium]|nr:MFS transporter [Eubacteriales bacterium]